MANQQHLNLLIKGVDIWNQWRDQNPEIVPDLRKANLSQLNLRGANLDYADLEEAILANTNLSEGSLKKANLSYADLVGAICFRTTITEANLSHAILINSDLSKANLEQANLSQAYITDSYLVDTNLGGANLEECDFTRSYLTGANLTGTNLQGADLSETDLTGTIFYEHQSCALNHKQNEIFFEDQLFAQNYYLVIEDLVSGFLEETALSSSYEDHLPYLERIWERTKLESIYQTLS